MFISISLRMQSNSLSDVRASDTGGPGGACLTPPCSPPTFLRSKKKKGKQRRAGTTFKAETIKRLSLRSKCYCFSHSRVFRIQKIFLSASHGGPQYFSVFRAPSTLKSISPALYVQTCIQ